MEIHNIETNDGYILHLFRIPASKEEINYTTNNKKRQPILLQHGLLDSSDGWICNSEEFSLPFILANKGYDIWLSNSRGNKHSRLHKTISPFDKEFWTFSFHEMGTIDLPAIIDYILKLNSDFQKIIYIGHSQGTCMLFAAITLMNEYFKNKIKLFIALAPIAKLTNMKSNFLKLLSKFNFHKLLKSAKQFEVFPDTEISNDINRWISNKIPSLANLALEMISDDNIDSLNNNKERMKVYLTHYPSGTSLQAMNHFIQNFQNKNFAQYDYKITANMRIYGQPRPLEYDLSKIKEIPIALFGGKEDKLSTEEDIDWLKIKIGENLVFNKFYEKMGHLSFLMGNDLTWINDAILLIDAFSIDEDLIK